MTFEHASSPRNLRDNAAQPLQTLPPSSRELGEFIPAKQPDGTPVAAENFKFGKSWPHFVAGG
jgi:solute carrier family 25 protein 33/36